MADYIDRQAVIDIVRGYGERFNNHIGTLDDSEVYAYARGLILSIESNICGVPSADVQPVVRCKDCKYQDKGENESESWNVCNYRPWLYFSINDDDYCSNGERK